jgi:hypothetical protein
MRSHCVASPVSTSSLNPWLQLFAYKTPDVPGVDRIKLQAEILDLLQQHGKAQARYCCLTALPEAT